MTGPASGRATGSRRLIAPSLLAAALSVPYAAILGAQAPDGNNILRAAGVDVPRGGAEAAFNEGVDAPTPIPPGAFATLIVGMGPVGPRARARNAYAFGVLAGRSGRQVPPGELAGAGIALSQMIAAEERAVRIAGMRVAGRTFAVPLDGRPAAGRPQGLEQAVLLMLNTPNSEEQAAAMEASGLLGETAAGPTLAELYRAYRERGNREMAAAALEALVRIGQPQTEPLARSLVGDAWAEKNDRAGLAAAFAREKFLNDGSRSRLESASGDRTLGPVARAYLLELGPPRTP
jgi:hypothetical protein